MVIRHVEDYYDLVKEKYPDLEMWEIDKILKHGFRTLFTLVCDGADVNLQSSHNSFFFYIGKIFVNDVIHNRYCFFKSCIKARIKYLHRKPVWDGYYYFGLTDEDYKKYFGNKKGRLKYKITFDKIVACKIREEAELYWVHTHFFKLKVDEEFGLKKVLENFTTRNVTEYGRRGNNGKVEEI